MFEQLIGNAQVKILLKRLLSADRVPNALLFAGPEAAGKKHFAHELARSFVCLEPVDGTTCGRCNACFRSNDIPTASGEKGEDFDRVFFGNHPDIGIVVPFRQTLRVNSIRALEREANFRPFEGRSRTFIVDDAEKLNDSSANALLKTLEEPPESSRIILITSRPDRLLQTIRSRMQVIRFAPVSTTEISTFLQKECGLDADDADLAGRMSNGQIGKALKLEMSTLRTMREQLIGVVEGAISRHGLADMLRTAEQLNDAKNKDNFEDNLALLEQLIRDIWLISTRSDTTVLVNIDIAERLAEIASSLNPKRISLWLEEIEQMRQHLSVNINRKIATDALFVKMAASV